MLCLSIRRELFAIWLKHRSTNWLTRYSWNGATGAVRSGQADLPANFKHYILKFDTSKPKDFPYTKVEMAYYLMAKDAGIDMMPSQLVEIEGTQNFLTQRFDRENGKNCIPRR